jgi:DNA-binding LacI/PurR family transcriptional regulator
MDGALIYSCDEGSAAVSWLKRRRLPLVFVDQSPMAGFSSVNIDDRDGARQAAQHIVDLGHRDIAIVTANFNGPEGVITDPLGAGAGHTSRQRMLGWLDALKSADIHPTVVQRFHSGEETGRDAAQLLFDLPKPPTAVLCFSDATAYGLIQGAENVGLSVPNDLSVVGFDDIPLAKRMHPPLTTVRQDAAAKGRTATSALVAAIERSKSGAAVRARHIVLPTELVVRDSTWKPSAIYR